MELLDRYRGCMLGLASGDALGAPVEGFLTKDIEPLHLTGMTGGGPWEIEPGQWTDDTSMPLCLAESLTEKNGFDPIDQLERYVQWMRHGHFSSKGFCFDIGGTTREALQLFETSRAPNCGSTNHWKAGNGSLMRLAPVPLFFAHDAKEAIERSGESSRTTHGATTAVDACRYFAGLLVGALNGADKAELLSARYCPVRGLWQDEPLTEKIDTVAAGSFKRKERKDIIASGYVVQSLEAALWTFHNSDTFREGCLLAVHLGYDTDTTAAIYGQLAGAHYGVGAIPEEWLDVLAKREWIESAAEKLFATANAR